MMCTKYTGKVICNYMYTFHYLLLVLHGDHILLKLFALRKRLIRAEPD